MYSDIKIVINAHCLTIDDDLFSLNIKDSQGVISKYKAKPKTVLTPSRIKTQFFSSMFLITFLITSVLCP